MNCRRKLQGWEDEAASEIIGTLVLIALIAGAITIFGTVLFSQPVPGAVPAATIVITNESTIVRLYHGGGDPIPVADLVVIVNGNPVSFSGAGSDNVWTIGETLTAVSSTLPFEVTVTCSGRNGQAVLASGPPEIR